MFKRINLLITEQDFAFQSWSDRYGKGVWTCLAPNKHLLDEIYDYTTESDIDMINASDYIEPTNWLPFVTGIDFISSLEALENLLASLPQTMLCSQSIWSDSIHHALENLSEMRRMKSYNLYPALPETFEDLLSNPCNIRVK